MSDEKQLKLTFRTVRDFEKGLGNFAWTFHTSSTASVELYHDGDEVHVRLCERGAVKVGDTLQKVTVSDDCSGCVFLICKNIKVQLRNAPVEFINVFKNYGQPSSVDTKVNLELIGLLTTLLEADSLDDVRTIVRAALEKL